MVNPKGIEYYQYQMEKEKISKEYLCDETRKGKRRSPYLLCMCRVNENKYNNGTPSVIHNFKTLVKKSQQRLIRKPFLEQYNNTRLKRLQA